MSRCSSTQKGGGSGSVGGEGVVVFDVFVGDESWWWGVGVVLVVGAAFGQDRRGALLGAGAVRRGIFAVLSPWRSSATAPTVRGPVGAHRVGKIRALPGWVTVLCPVGAGPDQGAVAELFVAPAPERLEQVMKSAFAGQVRGVGGSAVAVGDDVVDVAVGGRDVAVREATGQVAVADEVGQRPRRPVPRFGGGVAGMDQRLAAGRSWRVRRSARPG